MEWLVDVVASVTDKPLAIDSDVPGVVAAGLRRYRGAEVMVNSVTADPSRLQSMGALAAERNGLVVALAMGAVSFQSERKMQRAEPISRLTGKASLQSSAGFATRST
jgi:cobalamin-dependent methionine synthase I